MSEIMDDYEEGFTNGHEEGFNNGHEEGFADGKKFAQNKVLKLMDEVIHEYKTHARAGKMDSESSKMPKAQLNAVLFMKSWVLSGGLTDEKGNRTCLVW